MNVRIFGSTDKPDLRNLGEFLVEIVLACFLQYNNILKVFFSAEDKRKPGNVEFKRKMK